MLPFSFVATPTSVELELSVRPDEAREFDMEVGTTPAVPKKEETWRIPKKKPEEAPTTNAVATPGSNAATRRPRRRRRRGGVHYPQQSFLWPGPSHARRVEYRRHSPVRATRPRAGSPNHTLTRECGNCQQVRDELATEKQEVKKMSDFAAKLTKELVDERAKLAATKSELAAAKEAGNHMDHRERTSWSHQLLLMRSGMRSLENRQTYHQRVQGLQQAEKNMLEQRVRNLDIELMSTRDTFRKAISHATTCTGQACQDACHKWNWGGEA